MKLESQVTSLELSIKLQEIGIPQESIFVWEYFNDECYSVKFVPYALSPNEYNQFKLYSAFTASELLNMIPEGVSCYKDGEKFKAAWFPIHTKMLNDKTFSSIKLVDSLAKILICFKKNEREYIEAERERIFHG